MDKLITILTPVYNRRKQMKNLYDSLCNQDVQNFVWLVIDDGSTDDLYDEILKMKEEAPFEITYQYKENGGKHTALNMAFELLETELTFIVDSDDTLKKYATEMIECEWNKVRDKDLSGIAFHRGYSNGKIDGDPFPEDGIYNDIDVRTRYRVGGDKAEVWRSDLLKQYKFPVFPGEKYMGEKYVWQKIALNYDMMYINKIIYIFEYLDGGLTKTGRILKIQSPLGGMECSKIAFNERYPLREKIKNALLFVCYGKFAGKSFLRIVKESEATKLIIANYIGGYLIFLYWKHKYL